MNLRSTVVEWIGQEVLWEVGSIMLTSVWDARMFQNSC